MSEPLDLGPKLGLVGVIGCCRQKLDRKGPAREVYASRHFRVTLAWAEAVCARVVIASTKLGVIDPDQEIEPYDHTFSKNSAALGVLTERPEEREAYAWGVRVAARLRVEARGRRLVFVLGGEYMKLITPHLLDLPWDAPWRLRLATRTAALLADLRARGVEVRP